MPPGTDLSLLSEIRDDLPCLSSVPWQGLGVFRIVAESLLAQLNDVAVDEVMHGVSYSRSCPDFVDELQGQIGYSLTSFRSLSPGP